MATTTRVLDANVNGTVYTSNANAALEALDTCHSGVTAPTDEVANGKLWLDTSTTPGILKIYNNATWEVVHSGTVDINGGSIDGTVIGGTTPAAVTGTTLTATGAFTSLGIDDNAAATAVTIDASNNVGIGTASPASPLDVTGSLGITVSQSKTDATTKSGRIRFQHYTNAEEPVTGLLCTSASGSTSISYGGGSGAENATTEHRFYTAGTTTTTTGTERMRINSSGNVGIGTASPSYPLHVSGNAAVTGQTFMGSTLSAATPDYSFINDSSMGMFRLPGVLGFSTGGTERMRIDSSGNVLVGTTNSIAYSTSTTSGANIAPGGAINGSVESSRVANFNRRTTTGDNVAFRYNGTIVGTVSVTGSATAYNTSSDYRLKENITPVQGAVDIVKAMQPVTYTFKSDGSWHDGFLAHELQELHPRAVTGSKDAMKDEEYEVTPAVEATYDAEGVELTPAVPAVMGTRSVPDYQGVDYSKLTPILTAALQEALNKIDALEARVAALEP